MSERPTTQTTDEAQIGIDYSGRIIEIYGIRYALDLFKHIGMAAIGSRFEIIDRGDGVVTLQSLFVECTCPTPDTCKEAGRCLVEECTGEPWNVRSTP